MTIYRYSASAITGETLSMQTYAGRVCLIVNVASACGYTPQYAGLEALYRRYQDQGLVVLGFPCDQFGHQEPGNESAILEFCSVNFGVTFPLFAKIEVNGPRVHPLFQFLKSEQKGLLGTARIKWNFTKFLVNRGGEVIARYGPRDTPESIEPDVVRLLAEKT